MRFILASIFVFNSLNVNAQADIIFHHGKIFTSDRQHLWDEAIAIKGDRILDVGADNEILKLKSPNTRVVDLQGRLLVPGFNDAHDHAGSPFPARRFSFIKQPFDPTPWEIVKDSISRISKEIEPGTFIITTV